MKPLTPAMLYEALRRIAPVEGGGEAAPAAVAAPTHRLAGLRLLLVEDNPLNQQVASALLQLEGAEVDVANNGREGVDQVMSGPSYDAVLMDMQMPVMDGNEATRLLRAQGYTGLPILALTANVLEAERDECRAAGVDDFIAKPIEFENMVAMVARYCAPAVQRA